MDEAAPQGIPARLFETIANYTYDWESWLGLDGRPRWVNPAVERMTGYRPGECLTMADYPLPLVHPDDRAAMRANLQAAAEGVSGNDVAFRILRRDGRTIWGAISWQSLFDEAGRALGFRTSVRDITQRKEAEEALERARGAAEEASRAKSRFLAAASHDLRQPIQAAALFVAALRQRAEGEELRGLVGQLGECLSSTQELLDQLLDMSRLDAQLLRNEPVEIALGDLFERLELEFAQPAVEQGLRFRIAATSLFVRVDPLLLFRILQNLVANALRYTHRGGVLLGARRRGARVRISVHDSGVGIPQDKLELVFQEFLQLGNPARDRTRGLGLGLAIVKRLAGLMELPLGLESTRGVGSHFWVEVPLVEVSEETLPRLPSADVEARRGRRLEGRCIALLEDDASLLAALLAYLTGEGARVVSGLDRAELSRRLDESQCEPEALVVDYGLRGETGVEAADALSARLGRALPTVILTGDTDPVRLREVEASGHCLLHKPTEPSQLVSALLETIGT